MNIYLDDKTVYGCNTQILDYQSLAVDLSPERAITAEWGEELAGYLRCLKNQTNDLLPPPIEPRIITNRDEWMLPREGHVP